MEYQGHTVMQTANNHVWIINKEGKAVEHIICEEKKTEIELQALADKFFKTYR